jgi:nitrogen fixation/metabolism regulation signal transduction histidine kinase
LLIQQKFAETEFGSQNELIVYQRDDEIGQLVKQYNKMVMELEASANKLAEQEREGAWREMAKQVAHEIKNPLTPMKLSIQHLQRAFESGRDVEELFKKTSKLLIDQIESLSTMAGEFSGFAQMPSRAPEAFNVSEVLSDTLSLYELYDRIKFKRSISENVYVLADKEQIKRVFTNLLKNALQAIPDEKDGEISIQLWSDESKVQIRVQDNGVGIQEELRKKAFIPNFSTKNSGMGLGLAISRKIVESSGGEIGFTSEVGAGTTFELWLPLQGED